MKTIKVKNHIEVLDTQIQALLGELSEYDITSGEYESVVERIEELVDVRETLKPNRQLVKELDPGVVISAVVSIVSLGAILVYEKEDTIITKGMPILTKWLGK